MPGWRVRRRRVCIRRLSCIPAQEPAADRVRSIMRGTDISLWMYRCTVWTWNAPHDSYPSEISSVKELVWYNIYRRAVRAVEAVAELRCADANRIAVCGGSQGGRLSIIVASLDSRVRAAVPCIANSPNMPHLYWTRRCNGEKTWWAKASIANPLAEATDGTESYGAFNAAATPQMKVLAYIDPINLLILFRLPIRLMRHIFAGEGRIRRLSPFPVTDTTGGRLLTERPIAGSRRS